MIRLFYFVLLAFLFSCITKKDNEFLESELEAIDDRVQNYYVDIQIKKNEYPNRYSAIVKHSESIHSAFDSIKDYTNDRKEFDKRFDRIKKLISKSKLYHGSVIFTLLEIQYSKIDNTNDSFKRYWYLSNLEGDLQNYLYKSLNADYLVFKNIETLIVDDTMLYVISADSTAYQKLMIWDISKPKDLFADEDMEKFTTTIELQSGVGFFNQEVVEKFPNGFHGIYKVSRNDGGINIYPFTVDRFD